MFLLRKNLVVFGVLLTVRRATQSSQLPGYIDSHVLPEPVLDANTVCQNTPTLNKEQMKMCRLAPQVTASAFQGMRIAIRECQHQLRFRRWDCSTLEGKSRSLKSVGLLSGGFRETAFVHAIVSAGVVQAVASSCSLGRLSNSCSCDETVRGEGRGWKWAGCSDDVLFASKFATKFLDSRGSDITSEMNVHNNRVGRLAVVDTMKTRCRCQGVSASCSVKTCWRAVTGFREIGDILLEKYDHAIMVKHNNRHRGASAPKLRRFRRKFKQDLIFLESSPDYCRPNRILGIAGTSGRVCTADSLDTDSCQSLCCGRGYVERNVTLERKCRCHYNWCCYSFCQKCAERGLRHVCN